MIGPKTKVVLQKPNYTTTSTGSRTELWEDVVAFRGIFSAVSSKERLYMDKDTVFYTHRLIVPYSVIRPDYRTHINGKNRIRIGTVLYEIKGVMDHTFGRVKHWRLELLEVE